MRTVLGALLIGSLAVTACGQNDRQGNELASPPGSGTTAKGTPVGAGASEGEPNVRDNAAASPSAKDEAAAGERASWREVTIPAGTTLPVVLETAVGSDISSVEQPVHARLRRAITIDGVTALPQGAAVSGVVTDAIRSGRVKGRAHVAVRFDGIAHGDERYALHTATVARTAPATKKNDAVKILAPAAGGAIIGRVAGGRKGAVIGTAAGAGAGAAVVMSTRGKEVRLARGTALVLKLTEPLTVRVRVRG
jgi:hypothetical protein